MGLKRILTIMLILCATASGVAQGFTYIYKGVEFKGKIDKGEATIKSFDKKEPNVTIPATVTHKGVSYPVKTISVFMNGVNYSTVNLTLEEGIEEIDKFCFNEFRKLLTVNLPMSLRHIGKTAFRDNEDMALNMPSCINELSLRKGKELYPDGSGSIESFKSPGYLARQEKIAQQNKKAELKEQKEQQRNKELMQQLKEQEKLLKAQQELLAKAAEKSEESTDNESEGKGLTGALSGLFGGKKKKRAKNDKQQPVQQTPAPAAQPQPLQPSIAATETRPAAPELPPVDVDIDIPVVNTDKNTNTYCVIIANEKYEDVPVVDFAERDGAIFREYCIKTLGVPEKQVKTFINASYTDIKRALNWVETMSDISEGQSKVIFYYAGHGIPNEKDKTAYLIPTDGFPKDITTCFKLSDLYARLGKLKTQNVTVLLDACFSGVKRGSGQALVAARGVAIKPKNEVLTGNMVVFTAASDDETALSYNDKRHGMFTYFLLDKLKKTQGNATFGEIFSSISVDVKKNSMLENDKLQTPSVNVSTSMKLKWEKLQF